MKWELRLFLPPRALADCHQGTFFYPLHIACICIPDPHLIDPIERKITVKGGNTRNGQRFCERKDIHIRRRGEVSMHDIKSVCVLFQMVYCLMEMIIRLEMRLPGGTLLKQRAPKKRDQLSGCLCICRCKERDLVPLRYLL